MGWYSTCCVQRLAVSLNQSTVPPIGRSLAARRQNGVCQSQQANHTKRPAVIRVAIAAAMECPRHFRQRDQSLTIVRFDPAIQWPYIDS